MDPRHDDQPHITGRGFVLAAALAALLLAALHLCDDTRWIDRHQAASRAASEAGR